MIYFLRIVFQSYVSLSDYLHTSSHLYCSPLPYQKAQDSFQGLPDSDPAHDEPYFAEGDFGSEGSNAQRFQQLLENFGLNSTIDLMILGYHPSQNAGHAWGLPGDGFGALTSCEMISDLLRKRHHWKS